MLLLLLRWLLLWGHGVLLLGQETVGIVASHDEVVALGDKLVAVNNLLVVKKHTSDLAGEFSVAFLDDGEDGVSNLLLPHVGVGDLVEHLVQVNEWLHQHLWLLLSLHHVLLLLLLGIHLLLHGHLLVWHVVALHLLLHNLLHWDSLGAHHAWLVVVVHAVVTWTTLLVVELAALVVGSALALLVASVAHLVVAIVLLTVHLLTSVHSLEVLSEVLEEVLLHLLETAVLALLVKLTAWHPVLDGEGSGSEWSGVVILLDGLLGILNILEKNEVLAVSSIWVEVLALTHLDGNDWSASLEKFNDLFLGDLSWDVFHKEVGLVGLSDGLLDGVSIGGNLVVS